MVAAVEAEAEVVAISCGLPSVRVDSSGLPCRDCDCDCVPPLPDGREVDEDDEGEPGRLTSSISSSSPSRESPVSTRNGRRCVCPCVRA